MRGLRGVVSLLALAAIAASVAAAPGTEAHKFKIIVNSANTTATISRTDLASIYLKKKTRWPDGT